MSNLKYTINTKYCQNTPAKLVFRRYPEQYGGRIAIQFFDAENHEPLFVATTNIPEAPLADGEILIKNWSENEGVLENLCDLGIIENTGKVVPTGFVEANVCKLLIDIPEGV